MHHQLLSCPRKQPFPTYAEACRAVKRWSRQGDMGRRDGLHTAPYRCICGAYHLGDVRVTRRTTEESLENILAAIEAELPSTVLAGVRFGFKFGPTTKSPMRRLAGTVSRQLMGAVQMPRSSQRSRTLAPLAA